MADDRREDSSPNGHTEDRPQWWEENRKLRASLGIGDFGRYEPPQFADGRFAFEVVSELESEYDCMIRLLSVNPEEDNTWEIRVDGRTVATTECHRTDKGNDIYDVDSETFLKLIEEAMTE